ARGRLPDGLTWCRQGRPGEVGSLSATRALSAASALSGTSGLSAASALSVTSALSATTALWATSALSVTGGRETAGCGGRVGGGGSAGPAGLAGAVEPAEVDVDRRGAGHEVDHLLSALDPRGHRLEDPAEQVGEHRPGVLERREQEGARGFDRGERLGHALGVRPQGVRDVVHAVGAASRPLGALEQRG